MFPIDTQVVYDAKVISGLNQREFNKAMKEALQNAVKFWHKNMIPEHFTRRAYNKYPQEYSRRKKRGEPLVQKGHLRKQIANKVHISGTSKKVRARMYYGRPGGVTHRDLKRRIFYRVKFKGQTYRDASRAVYREAGGYDKETKWMFNLRLTAISKKEVDELNDLILDRIVNHYKPSGKKVKARLKNGQ